MKHSSWWIMLFVGAMVLSGIGCSKREEACCPCPAAQQLDEGLMLLLATARAYHHQADLHLQQGEVQQAIQTVRQILALELDAKWPEAEELRLDATARLAKLLAGQGKDEEACALVDKAIAAAQRESFYLANLHSVKGEILEQLSKRQHAAGDQSTAKQTARDAIIAFEQSIAINKRLQQRLVPNKGQP